MLSRDPQVQIFEPKPVYFEPVHFKGGYRGQTRSLAARIRSGVPVTDFSFLRKMTVKAHPEIRPAIYLSTLSILI